MNDPDAGKHSLGWACATLFWAVVALVCCWHGYPDCTAVATICAGIFGLFAGYWLGEHRNNLRMDRRRNRPPFNLKFRNEEAARFR